MIKPTTSKDYERALFALSKLPSTITAGLSHDIDTTKLQLEVTLEDITKRHSVLENIVSHAQQEYKLLRQELVHLTELKNVVSETLYELLSITSSTQLVQYLHKKKQQVESIIALQKNIAFMQYNKEISKDYETAKLLYAGNTAIISELDRVYKDAEQKFISTLRDGAILKGNRKSIVTSYQALLEEPQIKKLTTSADNEYELVKENIDEKIQKELSTDIVGKDNMGDTPQSKVDNDTQKPTDNDLPEISGTDSSLPPTTGVSTKNVLHPAKEDVELTAKSVKSRHRRGRKENLNYLSIDGITEYKIKKQWNVLQQQIHTFKSAHRPLYAIFAMTERLKANKYGRYDINTDIFSLPSELQSKLNLHSLKGDLSEAKKIIKLWKLASDVSLLHNCLPVIDMKNDDGTYAIQQRESQLKEFDTDSTSVLKTQKRDRPSINIARIRNLKKMTDGVLNINTKLNTKKVSSITVKLINIINLAHKEISPKAWENKDFHFCAQEIHIERIIEVVDEFMNFIAAHVNGSNELLKIVSYTCMVMRIIEETVVKNALITEDTALINCTNRILSQLSLMLESELYKSYGEKFNTQEFELLERIHVHGKLIGDRSIEGYASQWLSPIYATLNTISQRINTQKIVYETFDTENEEIGEEGWKMIAQRYALQFQTFSVKSKMYSAPEVISRGYGVKNVEHLFWLKEIPNSPYAGMLLLGDIDIFINMEAWDQKIDELCVKTGDDQSTIEYYASPLPFVRNLYVDEGVPSYDIVTRGKAGALFLHKNGDLSLDYEDVEDLKYILGKEKKSIDGSKDIIDSKTYYMLQAYILYHILESHNIIDKRKDHPVFRGPRLHTVERESKDIVRKDPRVIYNAPVTRDSGITRNLQYRSETFVRHYKKDMFTANDFIESLSEKKAMKAGVYRINDYGDPYYEELSFDLNRLPLPSEIQDLLDVETLAWVKSITTDVQGYIQEPPAFVKLQSLIKKTVEAGRLGCAFYIKYYRREHRKPGAKKTPKTIYQIFGKSIEKRPSETDTASIERLIHRQPLYVQNLFHSLEKKMSTGPYQGSNIQWKSHSNQIHCIRDKEPLFTLSLANFIVAHIYIDLPEEVDNIIVIKDENSINELLTLLQTYSTKK